MQDSLKKNLLLNKQTKVHVKEMYLKFSTLRQNISFSGFFLSYVHVHYSNIDNHALTRVKSFDYIARGRHRVT